MNQVGITRLAMLVLNTREAYEKVRSYLWNAQVYEGRLCRYAPDGKLDRVVEMPVKKVASVNFGGPDLDILFVAATDRGCDSHVPEHRCARRDGRLAFRQARECELDFGCQAADDARNALARPA